jgi:hypothetical protein
MEIYPKKRSINLLYTEEELLFDDDIIEKNNFVNIKKDIEESMSHIDISKIYKDILKFQNIDYVSMNNFDHGVYFLERSRTNEEISKLIEELTKIKIEKSAISKKFLGNIYFFPKLSQKSRFCIFSRKYHLYHFNYFIMNELFIVRKCSHPDCDDKQIIIINRKKNFNLDHFIELFNGKIPKQKRENLKSDSEIYFISLLNQYFCRLDNGYFIELLRNENHSYYKILSTEKVKKKMNAKINITTLINPSKSNKSKNLNEYGEKIKKRGKYYRSLYLWEFFIESKYALIFENIEYNGYNSLLGKIKTDKYNLFRGFSLYYRVLEDFCLTNRKNLNNFNELLKKHFCNQNDKVYEYLLDYLSTIIQKPNIKPKTTIIFLTDPHDQLIYKKIEILANFFN